MSSTDYVKCSTVSPSDQTEDNQYIFKQNLIYLNI